MNEKIKVLGVSINHYTAKEAMKKVMEYMGTEPINVIEMVTMNTLSQLLNKEEQKTYIDECLIVVSLVFDILRRLFGHFI